MVDPFLLQSILFSVAVTLASIGFVQIVVSVFVRRNKLGRIPQRDSRTDFTNMLVLFQTMRDLLDQQKELAGKLSKSLDTRVETIKGSVDVAQQDLVKIHKAVKALNRVVRDLDAQVALVEEKTAGAKEPASVEEATGTGEPGVSEPSESTDEVDFEPVGVDPSGPVEENGGSALQALAEPEGSPSSPDIIDNWVGLDFGGDEPDPLAFDVPELPPDKPEDPEAARDAFRALLDMGPGDDPEPAASDVPRSGARSRRPGNGKDQAGPPSMQMRVYEYSDAGMSFAEIAKELGIGKGEVRLILSLREDKER